MCIQKSPQYWFCTKFSSYSFQNSIWKTINSYNFSTLLCYLVWYRSRRRRRSSGLLLDAKENKFVCVWNYNELFCSTAYGALLLLLPMMMMMLMVMETKKTERNNKEKSLLLQCSRSLSSALLGFLPPAYQLSMSNEILALPVFASFTKLLSF